VSLFAPFLALELRFYRQKRAFKTVTAYEEVPIRKMDPPEKTAVISMPVHKITSKGSIMFCPRCKSEYREGFTKCADCEVPLVDVLPDEVQPDADPHDLVSVFETSSQPDILVIKSALDAEGIIFHFSGEFFHMMGVMPSPARLLVPSDQREKVLHILKEMQFIP
jgi:hypothetical protein